MPNFLESLALYWEKRILNESGTNRNLLRTRCGLHFALAQARGRVHLANAADLPLLVRARPDLAALSPDR